LSPCRLKASSSVNTLPSQRGAGIEQGQHDRVGGGGGLVRREPGRVAGTGDVARHVEEILGREVQAGERPGVGAADHEAAVRHPGADGVVDVERR
jgi:hypothetical protein